MIDKPYQVTPEALRQEANNLEYTGRQHHAEIMRWAADSIEELEELVSSKGLAHQNRELRLQVKELEAAKELQYEIMELKNQRIEELEADIERLQYRSLANVHLDYVNKHIRRKD